MNIVSILGWFAVYRYPVIFIATIIEGPIIMMLAGIMLRLGDVSFVPIYVTLMLGDLVGDIFWYGLGYHFAHPIAQKYGKYVGLTPELLEKTRVAFHNHQGKILFISKITMGFGFALAVLVTAGMSKMSFKKYLVINASGQFVWTGFLLALGYFFGNLYENVNKDFRAIGLVVFVIVAFVILRGITSYLKTRDMNEDLGKIL